ncbi:MAG: hypothetical protein DRJ07_18155, partial [Bacteroidetes bacterium]
YNHIKYTLYICIRIMSKENRSTPFTLSMYSFPPSTILTIDNRGVFFEKLANLTKIKRVHQSEII